MTITQKSSVAQLQNALGLTAAQLPDAASQVFLDKVIAQMNLDFEDFNFDDSETSRAQMQTDAEISLGVWYYLDEYIMRRLPEANHDDADFLGNINLGGVRISSSQLNQRDRLRNYRELQQSARGMYERMRANLLRDTADIRGTSDFLS